MKTKSIKSISSFYEFTKFRRFFKMLVVLNVVHQKVINFLIFIAAIFGCWTFKLNNSFKIVDSRILQLWNKVLVLFLFVSLVFMIDNSCKIIRSQFRDTFSFLIAINNIIFMSFILFVYSFICYNREELKKILNEVLDLSRENLKVESNLKVVSILIAFEALLIQPWSFIDEIFVYFRGCNLFFTENFLINEVFIFIFPARIFVFLFCLLLKFHSLLLQNLTENDFNVEKLAKFLNATKKICKLFHSLVLFHIFVEFVFLNGMCYGIFMSIIDRLRGSSDDLRGLEFTVFRLMMIVLNLYVVLASCKDVKRKVKKFKH